MTATLLFYLYDVVEGACMFMSPQSYMGDLDCVLEGLGLRACVIVRLPLCILGKEPVGWIRRVLPSLASGFRGMSPPCREGLRGRKVCAYCRIEEDPCPRNQTSMWSRVRG
jgi:hypothetical protein